MSQGNGKQSYREAAKLDWYPKERPIETSDISTGALQRIADAAEKMGHNILLVMNSRDEYKRQCERWKEIAEKHERTITRLKREVVKLERQLEERS